MLVGRRQRPPAVGCGHPASAGEQRGGATRLTATPALGRASVGILARPSRLHGRRAGQGISVRPGGSRPTRPALRPPLRLRYEQRSGRRRAAGRAGDLGSHRGASSGGHVRRSSAMRAAARAVGSRPRIRTGRLGPARALAFGLGVARIARRPRRWATVIASAASRHRDHRARTCPASNRLRRTMRPASRRDGAPQRSPEDQPASAPRRSRSGRAGAGAPAARAAGRERPRLAPGVADIGGTPRAISQRASASRTRARSETCADSRYF